MKNIDIIKNSIEDIAIKNMFSTKTMSGKYTAIINTYRSLFDESTEGMAEEDIDTFLAVTFLLKAMAINDVMLNNKDTCELAVDTCISLCTTPLIIEKGNVRKLYKADYSEQKIERDVLIKELLSAQKDVILNNDISDYLRNMYINALKIVEKDTTSANNHQKLKSIFPKE